MNLKELKTVVDSEINNLHSYEKPEDIPVLVTLSETSIGSRAASGIKYAGMGFDWEQGQFRLEPVMKLVRKGNTLNDAKLIKCEQYDGRNYYFCPRCDQKISKDDKYCRHCSQMLKSK